MIKVNDSCVVGASGEISDFQELQKLLDELATEDYIADDGIVMTPREIHAYLCRVMYNRRNKCGLFTCLRLSSRHMLPVCVVTLLNAAIALQV